MRQFIVDQLKVEQFDTRKAMGRAAARAVHDKLLTLLKEKEYVNVLFAAAPSQNEMLAALISYDDIPWKRVNALHMDEYVALAPDAPQGFGNFLRNSIFDKVPFNKVWYLNGNAENLDDECARYTGLLEQYPLDIACTGIGENGHIAFNDPHEADFNDPKAVKCVNLDERCRNQQVHDGCFAKLDEVPKKALTLTVPTIMKAGFIVCVVPASTKAEAVKMTLEGEIGAYCPATVFRLHSDATLYLDADSAALLSASEN